MRKYDQHHDCDIQLAGIDINKKASKKAFQQMVFYKDIMQVTASITGIQLNWTVQVLHLIGGTYYCCEHPANRKQLFVSMIQHMIRISQITHSTK